MRTYRAIFRLTSPFLTPWHADTLFGHLCWALARRDGDNALTKLLDRCRAGTPPLVISDGFPPDSLPRPLLPPSPGPGTGTLEQQIAAARRGKMARERKWLTRTEFASILQGEPLEFAVANANIVGPVEGRFTTLHNQINRATSTTTGDGDNSGNLYSLSGDRAAIREVYFRVAEDIEFDWRILFQDLVQTGFGKRKSVGYGAIASCEIEEFAGFGEPDTANGFVSLSAFVPAASDPTDGFWRADVKYGKTGEEWSYPSPFKRPLVRLLAGAVFATGTTPGPIYGRLVDGIAPQLPEVAQYGFAFAVGLYLPDAQSFRRAVQEKPL